MFGLFNRLYLAIVGTWHRAYVDMGLIPPDAAGTPADQVRAVNAGVGVEAVAAAAVPAVEDKPAPEGAEAPRGRKAGRS